MLSVIEVRPAGLAMHKKANTRWKLPVDSATHLAMEFKCMLRYLQFFGSFPVYLAPKTEQETNWEFKAKRLTRQTIFPAMTSAIFFSLMWIKQILDFGIGNLDRYEMFANFTRPARMEKENCSGCITLEMLWKVFNVLVPIEVISTVVASWMDAPTFAKLFNEWVKLETEFLDACSWTARGKKNAPQILEELDASSTTLVGLPEWRKRYYFYLVLVPMMVVVPLYLYISLRSEAILDEVTGVSMALHLIVYPLVNDMTAAIMYRCMACAFHQTCEAMGSAVKSGQFDPELVSSWRYFIEKLRNQCKLISRAYTRTEFIYVAMMLVKLTMIIFMVFNGNRQMAGAAQVMAIFSFYGIANMLTLVIKVCAAEQIAHEESAIASLVVSVPARDSVVIQELKFIHDMIAMRPSEISVGNYITLNRRLVLSLIGQISTYLIVLMQFSPVH